MTTSVSLECVAAVPATFVLRLHESGGSWHDDSPYVGSGTVTVHGAIAVIRGLTVITGYSREVETAILSAVAREGARALIGRHGKTHRFTVWPIS